MLESAPGSDGPTWRNAGTFASPPEKAVIYAGGRTTFAPGQVDALVIDNPWPTANYGAAYAGADQWVPISVFEGAYSSLGDMALVLG